MKFLLCLSLVLTLSGCNKNKVENGKEAKNKSEIKNNDKKTDKDVAATKINKTTKKKQNNKPQQKIPPTKLKPPIKLMTEYFASMNKIIKENIKDPAATFEALNAFHQKETTKLDKIRKYYKQVDIKDYEVLFTDHKNNKNLIQSYLDFSKNLVKLAKKSKKMKKVKGYQLFLKNLIRPHNFHNNKNKLKNNNKTPDSPPAK